MGHLTDEGDYIHDEDDEVEQPSLEPKGGPEALTPYIGKWIVMDDEREIRGSGATAEEALRAADQAGLAEPHLSFVAPYGFIGGHVSRPLRARD